MTSTRARLTIALATAPLLLLAACTSVQPGQASPLSTPTASSTPPGTSQSNTPKTHTPAPPVTNPIDASKYLADPCASLTSTQLQEGGVTSPGKLDNRDTGPGCAWNIGSGASSVGIAYLKTVTNGLSNLYALNDTGSWKDGYFIPTEVDGYPATFESPAETRPGGECVLSVGITDQLFFTLVFISRPGTDSCTAVKSVASDVLTTIKAGS